MMKAGSKKRARVEQIVQSCSHTDSTDYTVSQLRQLLLQVLPEVGALGTLQQTHRLSLPLCRGGHDVAARWLSLCHLQLGIGLGQQCWQCDQDDWGAWAWAVDKSSRIICSTVLTL